MMRKSMIAILSLAASATLMSLPAIAHAATTAASQADGGIPSGVLWAGGIAGFLGFMLGSFPPNRGEMAGAEWDMSGAMTWALSMACIFGGGSFYLGSGDSAGLIAAGIGALLAIVRLISTRPPRKPQGAPLNDGINRVTGDSPKAKFKAAERAYNKASFQHPNRNYFATRSPRDWRYGASGMRLEEFTMLANSMSTANSNTFDILVLLVRELPGETNQPAVVVVRGANKLRAVTLDADGKSMVIPGVGSIPAASIAGAIGYAWR